MTRLVLIRLSGYKPSLLEGPDFVIPFSFRFIWGKLPSPGKLARYVGVRTDGHGPGTHWSDYVGRWRSTNRGRKDLSLVEFCQPYTTIELWFDRRPIDQLQLIWLLDHFSSHPEIAGKLRLAFVDFDFRTVDVEGLPRSDASVVKVTDDRLRTASEAWLAYRAPTPEACFHLLSTDLSALPQLRPCLLDLLEELPSATTGLGATEMRLLELIAAGNTNTNSLFHMWGRYRRRVFGEWELGALLEGLALGPRPAVAGLDEKLRTLDYENFGARHEIYLRSRLSLTEFGKAVVARKEDFSRHNPIRRWWGGTELTNERLWRWAPALMQP